MRAARLSGSISTLNLSFTGSYNHRPTFFFLFIKIIAMKKSNVLECKNPRRSTNVVQTPCLSIISCSLSCVETLKMLQKKSWGVCCSCEEVCLASGLENLLVLFLFMFQNFLIWNWPRLLSDFFCTSWNGRNLTLAVFFSIFSLLNHYIFYLTHN